MELSRRSTPSMGCWRGWSQVSLAAVHPSRPSPLSLCPRLAPPASILSSSLYPSEKAEETLERSIQPRGEPGVGEGASYIPLPINIQSVGEVPADPPHCSTHHPYHSPGGTWAPQGGGVFPPSALTRSPRPNPRPPGLAPRPPVPSHP